MPHQAKYYPLLICSTSSQKCKKVRVLLWKITENAYDIATFGNGRVSEGRKLLDFYFAKPAKEEIKRYCLWRIYVSLQWYNVAIVKHYRGEGAAHGFDFLKVAEFFLNNAKDALNGYLEEIR